MGEWEKEEEKKKAADGQDPVAGRAVNEPPVLMQ
jgi:hypothetical protein